MECDFINNSAVEVFGESGSLHAGGKNQLFIVVKQVVDDFFDGAGGVGCFFAYVVDEQTVEVFVVAHNFVVVKAGVDECLSEVIGGYEHIVLAIGAFGEAFKAAAHGDTGGVCLPDGGVGTDDAHPISGDGAGEYLFNNFTLVKVINVGFLVNFRNHDNPILRFVSGVSSCLTPCLIMGGSSWSHRD